MKELRVWDPFIRLFHWALVFGFALNWLQDEWLRVHAWTGYMIGALVVLRILWGFVGPKRARFADFVRPPGAVLGYLKDLVRFRARRYLGHSPAGGAMILALLVFLLATIATGMLTYGARDHAGPLAPFFQSSVTAEAAAADPSLRAQWRAEWRPYKQVHSLFANATLVLIGFHVGGVLLASFAHRENLVAAMLTGRKRRSEQA